MVFLKCKMRLFNYILLFLLAFVSTILYYTVKHAGWIHQKVLQKVDYTPSSRATSGYETLFIYIGSSRCGWSNVEELPAVGKQLK